MNRYSGSDDTIAAISTPEGMGGIAVIRISGNMSENILSDIFKPKAEIKRFEDRTIYYGTVLNSSDGTVIDTVLVSIMRSPNSYTGEDVVEIYSHGGHLIPKKILKLITTFQSRVAMPGEFTQRAYLNGKMDLAQAEAVTDIINAQTESSLAQAEMQLRGQLSDKINSYKDRILDIYAEVEAQIDFPEEDIDPLIRNEIESKGGKLIENITGLLETFDTGRLIKSGVITTILGKPNVGKSSLLNTMLQEDRAIVSHMAGTTRDFIEEAVNVNGVILNLTDTAGIRETSDQIETVGVDLAIKKADMAEFLIAVLDNSSEIDDNDKKVLNICKNRKHVVVINKTDLETKLDLNSLKEYLSEENIVQISIKKQFGITELKNKIFSTLTKNRDIADGSELYLTDIRHKNLLEEAKNHLELFHDAVKNKDSLEIMSIELRASLDHLGQITGEVTTEDLLGRIFSKFCIGK